MFLEDLGVVESSYMKSKSIFDTYLDANTDYRMNENERGQAVIL